MYHYHLCALDEYPSEVTTWLTTTPFHSEKWTKLVKNSLGIETQHTGVMDGNRLIAYLPYYYGGIFGTKIRSGPAVANYSPNLIFDENIAHESVIVHQLLARRYPDVCINSFASETSSTSIFNLDLSGSFEHYWQGRVHAKAKYDVRKADKHQITTQFLGIEACDTFYKLYSKRMQELGSPTLPRDFFRGLATYFKEDFYFAVSFKNECPVAASTLLGFNKRWIGHPWSVSDSTFRDISVNYAHYRDLIKHAFDHRYQRFYLGPSLKDSNWSRIKSRFGGEESFAIRLDGRVNAHASEGATVRTIQSVIRHLPASVYKSTSPTIARLAIKLLG